MNYQKLFNYMSKEHGVDLLESDMQEICNIVNEMQADNVEEHKTPLQILNKYFHHFKSERTRDVVVKAMKEYAVLFHQISIKTKKP